MEAKEYLNQAYRLNELIESNLRELERLEAMSTNITCGELKADRITGGVDRHDKIGDTVSKIVDLRREINAEIDELYDSKKEIAEAIKKIGNPKYQELLLCRYVEFNSWKCIADKMHLTKKGAKKMHERALVEIKKHNILCLVLDSSPHMWYNRYSG